MKKKEYIKPEIWDFFIPVVRASSCVGGVAEVRSGPESGCSTGNLADGCNTGNTAPGGSGCTPGGADTAWCVTGGSADLFTCSVGFSAQN
jgi:hypothetical protein